MPFLPEGALNQRPSLCSCAVATTAKRRDFCATAIALMKPEAASGRNGGAGDGA